MKNIFVLCIFCLLQVTLLRSQPVPVMPIPPLSEAAATKFAGLALQCLTSEYPNKLSHNLTSDQDVASPRDLYPAFYGCYDWHSAVHGHWLIFKALELFPEIKYKDQIIAVLNENLTKEHIDTELAYFNRDDRTGFERTYGWAWVLKLTSELAVSQNPQARIWHQNLMPLVTKIKERYYSYLPGLYYPIRRGVHENTAFGIAFAIDYARAVGDKTFEAFLVERAKFYYLNDKNIPASWEPDGDDFFSPSLIEADLMRRVLSRSDFIQWFKSFMPEIPFGLQHPVVVANRTDPKGVHLDGLNLSRAWCMFELAKVMPDDSQTHRDLWQSGYRHAAEALPNVLSDNYVGTHWLATFAFYMYLPLSDIDM